MALRWDPAGCRYSEKPLLRREISNGLYHYSSFFIAKGLVSLPFQLMFACIFTGSVYFLVRPSEDRCHHVRVSWSSPYAPKALLAMPVRLSLYERTCSRKNQVSSGISLSDIREKGPSDIQSTESSLPLHF